MPGPRHGHKYTKYEMYYGILMVMFKQHLSNGCSSIHEKVKQTEAELKKAFLIKKHVMH